MALLNYVVECLDARLAGYFKGSKAYGLCQLVDDRERSRTHLTNATGNEVPIDDNGPMSFWHRHLNTSISQIEGSGRGAENEISEIATLVLVAFGRQSELKSATVLAGALSSLMQTVPENWFAQLGYRTLRIRPTSIEVQPIAVVSAQVGAERPDISPNSVWVAVTYQVETRYLPSCVINTTCGADAVNCLEIACLPKPVVGPKGAKGDTGADGANGLSAYQIAVANGFVGSEIEWLASLVSTVPGPTGPEGPPGSTIASGVSYTPTDPLTATDVQAAIEQAVEQIAKATVGRVAVGGYYSGTVTAISAIATLVLAENILYAWPYFIGGNADIDRLQTIFSVAGAAGSVFRVGLYSKNGDNYPATLLVDSGELPGTTNLVQTIDFSAISAGGGYVFLAKIFGGGAASRPTIRSYQIGGISSILGVVGNSPNSNITGYNAAVTYGPLPANYPGGASQLVNVSMPCVGARRSA